MISLTTTIQEITLQAYSFGVYDYLFNREHNGMSRDEILNLFEDWGKEFEEIEKQHKNTRGWFYYDEIDEFVCGKFNEIKWNDHFPAGINKGDYITYEGGLYKVTGFDEDGAIAVDELKPGTDKDWIVCTIGISQADKVKIVEYENVMDTTNNHNAELVRKINDAWNTKRERFAPILIALYTRDIDEITDSDAFQYPDWIDTDEHHIGVVSGCWAEYNIMALNKMKEEWDFYAPNYLQHIADDGDLEVILDFLRLK